MSDLFVFVGLGNPGNRYRNTRHNVGFMMLDYFLKKINPIAKVDEYKFNSIINTLTFQDKRLITVFPLTFMNRSGIAVKQVINYYRISDYKDKLLVVHDDMDISLGNFKLKFNGSDGGHNGVKSVIENIGKDFYRLKIGISKPEDKNYVNYVLENFSESEFIRLNDVFEVVFWVLENILKEGIATTVSKLGIFFVKKGDKFDERKVL